MADKIFFASYARIDDEREELREVMKQLIHAVKVELGNQVEVFFDVQDIENGEEWEKRLGESLRNLRVLVSMCSPSYVKSAYCAKEFAVFRQRIEDAAESMGSAILPVIWVPTPLPAAIGNIHQAHDASMPADYALTGLRKYSQLIGQQDNFKLVLDALAKDIKRAYVSSPLDPWDKDVEFEKLPNSFDNPKPAPYGVQLTVLDHEESRWKPGYDNTIGQLFDQVTGALQTPWQNVPATVADLLAKLEDARKRRIGVIYVVDSAAAINAPWDQMLKDLDASKQTNFAVLVARPKRQMPSDAEKTAELQKLLPHSSGTGTLHDFFPRNDETACKNVLTRTISLLVRRLVSEDEAASVQADHLRDQAMRDGIEVDRLATLPNPGAQQ
jgi:hypothetical protein